MSVLEQSAPVHAKVFDKQMAETIARETGAPIDLATRILKEELQDLARDARITQFVNVLASRRARLKLQQHRDRRTR